MQDSPSARDAPGDTARPGRALARRRLIEACISALHIYGPSRTTVSRVVALADLSPGIVRFYFHSKAAMLVSALEYLADEFGQRVLKPVAALKHSPVVALGLLVELYLDAEIASPRKVSVWYSFWGEASSRQEYYDICGKKDEDFAALVRELIQRLISSSGARHLDADAVALGLIGVLEILWQGFAFQSEKKIDRRALVARALAYLRSVFPGQFPAPLPEHPRPRRPARR
jgi:TetR/AcrR family transcriptional regulator, transcriptional repressor of bet genes